MKYEVRQIDAWKDIEGWTWNESWPIGEFTTSASNERKAFTAYLKRLGITFKRNCTLITYDGDIYEIIDRKTKEPMFAAIPAADQR